MTVSPEQETEAKGRKGVLRASHGEELERAQAGGAGAAPLYVPVSTKTGYAEAPPVAQYERSSSCVRATILTTTYVFCMASQQVS